MSASCTASSASAKSPCRRATAPSTCGASSRSRCSTVESETSDVTRPCVSRVRGRRAHHLTHLDRHVERSTTGPRSRGGLRGELVRPLGTVDLDDPVAGEELLRLRKGSIGHRGTILSRAHQLRLSRRGQALAVHPLASVGELLVDPVHEGHVSLEVLGSPVAYLVVAGAPRRVHHQNVPHGSISSRDWCRAAAFVEKSEPAARSLHREAGAAARSVPAGRSLVAPGHVVGPDARTLSCESRRRPVAWSSRVAAASTETLASLPSRPCVAELPALRHCAIRAALGRTGVARR